MNIFPYTGRTEQTCACSNSTTETLEKSCDICSKLTIMTPEQRQ